METSLGAKCSRSPHPLAAPFPWGLGRRRSSGRDAGADGLCAGLVWGGAWRGVPGTWQALALGSAQSPGLQGHLCRDSWASLMVCLLPTQLGLVLSQRFLCLLLPRVPTLVVDT